MVIKIDIDLTAKSIKETKREEENGVLHISQNESFDDRSFCVADCHAKRQRSFILDMS
jgi:hypothetical protein